MPIRIGIIGCGGMAGAHVRVWQAMPEAQVAALADPSPEAMARLADRCGLDPAIPRFADHRQMLQSVPLDAVLIASPHTLHFQHACDALDAGVHVLLEKPMVCTTAHAVALVQRVRQSDRVVMLAYQRHFAGTFRYVRRLVQEGALGRLTFIQAFLSQEWMQATQGTWRQTPELGGGGELLDSGSHICDMLLHIPQRRVVAVSARCDFRGRPVDINTGAVLQYEDGLMGTLTIIGDAGGWWEDWTINGEEGTLYIRNNQITLKRYRQPAEAIDPASLPPSEAPAQVFVDVIQGRRPNETPVEVGLQVIRLTEAIWQSAAQGGAPVVVEG